MAAMRAAALATGRAAAAVRAAQRRGLAAAAATTLSRHPPRPTQAAPPAAAGPDTAAGAAAGSASAASPSPPLIDAPGRSRAEAYLDAVLAAATSLNLTAVRDRGPALARHISDSLDFLPPLDAAAAAAAAGNSAEPFSVIDVGAGAGFPGAVLAAARPAWRVTLLDALRKRTDFAVGAARKAGLSNAVPVWGRAEDVGKAGGGGGGKAGKKGGDTAAAAAASRSSSPSSSSSSSSSVAAPPGSHRERHDAVVARAVAETRILAELCLPLVKPGGVWVAAKGPDPAGEVAAAAAAIADLGGEVEALLALPPLTPGGPTRSLLVVRKVRATPDKYPRRAGMPEKRPL